jgi:phosphoglycerate dehydrogenase-like enzyme
MVVLSFGLSSRLGEALAALGGQRIVQVLSAGVDWLAGRLPDDVTLATASGVHDAAVSEWCVAAMLAIERRLLTFHDRQRERRWDHDAGGERSAAPVHDLEGRSVLIVGHGSIGRALEARLAPFGAEVTGVARTARPSVGTLDDLPRLLPAADVVVLLAPLTPDTERLVDEAFLARMRRGALLVNAARGRIVDTPALERALRAGHVAAALDTTDPEPLPADHSLWEAPNVLITPHVAGSTAQWRGRAHRFVGAQIRRLAAGDAPLNVRYAG